ncbi:molybdenum cofactor guanylyltransferase [Microbulbifer taiwanensis]|uniref:Molybdenum cofactor guanylyltransferase n=1 Tax=Microbulbifer taiwanensis TaxID=986746 RepID=A0ABW1YN91_9GAMM|nr:NTP transferase domain-containing protein [Microbulbifer taiwanensis]
MTDKVMRICPLLLAGGHSSRMGRDKAQVEISGGQTLLARAEKLLRDLPSRAGLQFMSPRISGDRPGGIRDLVPGRGPLGGLHSVVEYLYENNIACDALLAIPVDMPNLQRQQLQSLCAAGHSGGDSALCFGHCYLPLWLRLDNHSRTYLRACVGGVEDSSVGAMLRALNGRQLEMPPGDWHHNLNCPQALYRYHQSLCR